MTRGRRAVLVAVSAVLHVALFAAISRTPPRLRLPPELGGPVTSVEIVRLPSPAPTASRPLSNEAWREPRVPPELQPRPAAAPTETAAAPLPSPLSGKPAATSCAPEILLLLTPEERRECDTRRAAAAAMARRGFKPAESASAFSTLRPEVAQEFDAEVAAKAARRDVDAGQAKLKQFWADGPARAAPAWAAGNGNSGVAVQARCTVRFSGWKIEDRPPECRLGASTR